MKEKPYIGLQEEDLSAKLRIGDTVLAYVDDSSTCIGVVTCITNTEETITKVQEIEVLVLGWFANNNTVAQANVFREGKSFKFPTYHTFTKLHTDGVFPYSFNKELDLLIERNREWWSRQGGAKRIRTNLTRCFHPQNSVALTHIHVAKHIIAGGNIDDYKEIEHYSTNDFLHIWATLYIHFPDRVVKPPETYDEKGSNTTYVISIEDGVASIRFEFRNSIKK